MMECYCNDAQPGKALYKFKICPDKNMLSVQSYEAYNGIASGLIVEAMPHGAPITAWLIPPASISGE